ncbi:MAG: outer-membrane lipoprotein carrier protein LolA [Pseudomonadales bacterium]|nr:outer-membrane lipoprotein carrier protein LolA [Pseudomonadales bacterium]
MIGNAPQGALRSPVLGTLLGALLGLAALGPLISQAAPSAAPEGPMEASRPWTSGPAVKARFLDRLHTLEPLTGQFEQHVEDSYGQRFDQRAGRFALAPGLGLSWVTTSPFEEQLVLNKEGAWLWDPALWQAFRRPLSALAGTPATLLVGLGEGWLEDYAVETQKSEALERFRLLREAKTEIRPGAPARLELAWIEGTLGLISVEEGTGQRLILRLRALAPAALGPEAFAFEPPEGAEVIDEGAAE